MGSLAALFVVAMALPPLAGHVDPPSTSFAAVARVALPAPLPALLARPPALRLAPVPRPAPAMPAPGFDRDGRDRIAARTAAPRPLALAVDEGPVRWGLWGDVREVNDLSAADGPPAASGRSGGRPATLAVSGGRGGSSDLVYTDYRGGMFLAAPF
jgi:hypothetical protein